MTLSPRVVQWLTLTLAVLLLVFRAQAGAADARVLLNSAAIAEQEHRFDDAQRDLHRALVLSPRDAAAWLMLASVATVSGDVPAARRACSNAAAFVDPVATLACRGRIALATLEHKPAYSSLSRLLEHPHYSDREDVWTRWARGVAAELAAAIGNHEAADHYFLRAVQRSSPLQLQAAWLDHLLATSRPETVLAQVAPGEPSAALQIRRLIALRQLQREAEAASDREYFDWEFQYALEHEDYLHAREIARFYLDVIPRPKLALQAAQFNLERQREAEDYALYRRALAATE